MAINCLTERGNRTTALRSDSRRSRQRTGMAVLGRNRSFGCSGSLRPLTAIRWSYSQWPLTDEKAAVRTTLCERHCVCIMVIGSCKTRLRKCVQLPGSHPRYLVTPRRRLCHRPAHRCQISARLLANRSTPTSSTTVARSHRCLNSADSIMLMSRSDFW